MRLRSDRGPEFVNGILAELAKIGNFTHILGSAYAPWAQGKIESQHRILNDVVRSYITQNSDWPRYLYAAQWALRHAPQ